MQQFPKSRAKTFEKKDRELSGRPTGGLSGLVCTSYLHPKTPVSLLFLILLFHSPRSFPWLKGSNVCFVPPLPALMNIPGCISVSNGDEGVACLKARRAASKPRASCPENILTALFCPENGLLLPGTGSFCRPRQNAEWRRSGQVWGETDWHVGDTQKT